MADFNTFSLADAYSKAQAVRSAQQAEQMQGVQLQQLQQQQAIRSRLSDFIGPDGSIDMQRAIPPLLQAGDYHSIAALAAMQKANKPGADKPLRAPTPFEYESGAGGQPTGHPVVDRLAQTPEGRAALGRILRGGSSSTYVQGRDDDGNPTYIPMPSRPNAGGGSPAPAVRPKYDVLPEAAVSKLTEATTNYGAFKRAKDEFKEGFGGYGLDTIGEAALTLGAKKPDWRGAASQEATTWWKNYRLHDNTIRHGMIGSAMTPHEIELYDKATISPGMDDKIIQDNLATREKIAKDVASRLAKTHSAGNYNPAQVKATLGEHADTLLGKGAPKSAATNQTEQARTQIAEQFRAGKISREQARKKLQELGMNPDG